MINICLERQEQINAWCEVEGEVLVERNFIAIFIVERFLLSLLGRINKKYLRRESKKENDFNVEIFFSF